MKALIITALIITSLAIFGCQQKKDPMTFEFSGVSYKCDKIMGVGEGSDGTKTLFFKCKEI